MKLADDLSGNIQFVGLAEVFQLLGSSGATGELQAIFASGANGWVRFDEGEVCSAGYEDSEGVEAFYSLFHEEEGRFSFRSMGSAGVCMIRKNLTGLVMDGLRFADEKRAEEEEGVEERAYKPIMIRGPLVDYSDVVDEEFFNPGAAIVRQGRFGSWIWVILDGDVRVERELESGEVQVARMGRGAFIGAVAGFGIQQQPRSATIRAEGEVQLGVLDSQRLAKEYTAFSDVVKTYAFTLDGFQRKVLDFTARVMKGDIAPKPIPQGVKRIALREKDGEPADIRVKAGTLHLVYLCRKGQLPVASFGPGSILRDPVDSRKESTKRLVFLVDPETRVVRVDDPGEIERTLMECSPTIQKLMGFGHVQLKVLLGAVCDRLLMAEGNRAKTTSDSTSE